MYPSILYHGSIFESKELKPSYLITKIKNQWDDTESNEYLYSTTDKNLAIMMGAAAECERMGAISVHTTENEFKAVWENAYPRSVLHYTKIYIYTITNDPKDKWIKVNNKNNLTVDEYKTKSIISKDNFTVEELDFKQWAKSNNINIIVTTQKHLQTPRTLSWK